MISHDEYKRLKSSVDSYESARKGFDPKRFQRGGGYTLKDVETIVKAAGLTHSPTNEERSKIELYEFVHQPPQKYFAYYNNDLTKITNWMGETIGEIVRKGQPYKAGFGGSRVVNVTIRAVNGLTYSGKCFLDAGTYCRMTALKGQIRKNSVRKNIYAFNNPPSGPADSTAAHELELYIDNDRNLYFQQFIPIVKNLMLKRRKGVYNRELAVKLFMYLMDAGAKKYVAEFGTRGQKIDSMFNRNTRLQAARAFRDSFETEAELGNYDRLIGPVSNHRGAVRKNIYVFNNPRDSTVEAAARAVGLYVGVWSPGDGATRYRFFTKTPRGSKYADYHQGDGIYTALGRKDALAFIAAYGKGRSARRNPLTRSETIEIEHTARRERIVGEQIQSPGSRGYHIGRAEGMRDVMNKYGTYARTNPPSKSVRAYKVQSGHETQVASMLRDAFIWAQARDGEVLTVAQPVIVKRAIQYVRKHGYKRDPLTRSEAGYLLRHAKADVTEAAVARRHGLMYEQKYAAGHARGIGFAVQETGPKSARKAWVDLHTRLDRVTRNPCSNPTCANPRHGHPLPNPLLQTIGLMANPPMTLRKWASKQRNLLRKHGRNFVIPDGNLVNRAEAWHLSDYAVSSVAGGSIWFVKRSAKKNPPVSVQWDQMSGRQRVMTLEFVGFPYEIAKSYARFPWVTLSESAKRALERQWLDTGTRRETTSTRRRRLALPVGANPLTRRETAKVLRQSRQELAGAHGTKEWRAHKKGRAWAYADVAAEFGPLKARQHSASQRAKGAVFLRNNPPVRFPKPGTKLTVSEAFELARRIGDRALIEQCRKALRLQKAANKDVKCVIWKTFPMGSKGQIDSVIALTHYGDSPETMYKPPPGSKKGNHMYRHTWGEKGGKQTVPLLASADGKMLLMPLEGKKVASDWLRH
jgi:hypothetical protein